MRTLCLPGSVVSPYMQMIDASMTEPGRDIRIIPQIMILTAKIASYTAAASSVNVQVFLESSDASLNVGVVISIPTTYADTDITLEAAVATAINSLCASISLPNPSTIDWLFSTPGDVAAAIAAAIPPSASSYQTIVSQTSTAAPAVSGSLSPMSTYPAGTTFTWARTSAGVYTLTASTAVFNTSGKTGVFVAPLQNLNASVRAVVTSTTVITVTTAVQSVAVLGLLGLTTTATDALLSQTMLYVQTYP